MKKNILLMLCMFVCMAVVAQPKGATLSADTASVETEILSDDDSANASSSAVAGMLQDNEDEVEEESGNFYQVLKTKFIEGTPAFMSLVALTLIIGLGLCIERMLRLGALRTDTSAFMEQLRDKLSDGDMEGARSLCVSEPHPLGAVALKALEAEDELAENRERMMQAEANKQTVDLEKGCSWISLCIRLAPSLGFLGTVIGMVIAFDRIEAAGDISPTLVAAGMKVALITTIFGIITALILQVFYNIILNKIQRIVGDIEQKAPLILQMRNKKA